MLKTQGLGFVAQAGRELLASSDPPISASQSAETTGSSPCSWPKTESCCVAQGSAHCNLRLPGSSNSPALPSQVYLIAICKCKMQSIKSIYGNY
ncbi:hypothetical protein AAY473_014433 [Plecturocebus cupreus]